VNKTQADKVYQISQTEKGRAAITFKCSSTCFWIGTGIRGNKVENHSSLLSTVLIIIPIVITHPPPAFTSISCERMETIGWVGREKSACGHDHEVEEAEFV